MAAHMARLVVPQDLRLRLVAAFVVVIALSQLQSLTLAATVLGVLVLFALAGGLEAGLARRLWHVEGLVALLVVTLPFTEEGTPVFSFGPLAASAQGLIHAGLLACKITAAALALMVLLGALEPARLGAALHGLRVPEKLVRLLVICVRYLAILRAEARRGHEAMRARGFRARSNRHTWRSYGYLIAMLLVRALERAQRVEDAMLCRGFNGRLPHADLKRPCARDWLGFALLTGLAVATLVGDRA